MGTFCGLSRGTFRRAESTAASGPMGLPSMVFTPFAPPRSAKTYRPVGQRRFWAPGVPTGLLRIARVQEPPSDAVTEEVGSSSHVSMRVTVPPSTLKSANVAAPPAAEVSVAGSIWTACGTYRTCPGS